MADAVDNAVKEQSLNRLEIDTPRPHPLAGRSAMHGKYGGELRKISGWAFKTIDEFLNPPFIPVTEPGWRIPMSDVVVCFDDTCKVGDSPLITQSSVISNGTPYVVWVQDCAQLYEWTFRGRWEGYGIYCWAKNRTFGSMGHEDTLDAVMARYDALRGHQPEQPTLF